MTGHLSYRRPIGVFSLALLLGGCGALRSLPPSRPSPPPSARASTASRAASPSRNVSLATGLIPISPGAPTVPVGAHPVAVLFVNPASPLSAYAARWLLIPHLPASVELVMVLALPASSVATPGPMLPAVSGHAGQAVAVWNVPRLPALVDQMRTAWQVPSGTMMATVSPATLQAWHVNAWPTLWLVAASGRILARYEGVWPPAIMQSALQGLASSGMSS
ncbi:hypothetical protein [Sulfobacillus thermosulfidooxidans]|uniref:hypothetical protein n=1 Tax=Sulfobacillus thermosulfidooxidans TaxID=28034 RepID=UPI0002FD8D74|nr:hypothetical protein [Sulfobacillus thermosulfidooxidans]